jgi:hypothetical protein
MTCGSFHDESEKRPVSHSRTYQQFPAKYKMTVIPHPPYSPDLAPCDFFLFQQINLKLKGCQFDRTEEIQAKSQRVLDTLTEKDFQEAVQKWRRWWDRCLHAGGNTLKVMAASRPYGEFYDFYSVSPEYFGYHLMFCHILLCITA